MTAQYLRKFRLIVGNDSGNGLDLSDMHVRFETHRQEVSTPAWALIRIYNLSKPTMERVQKEFTQVAIEAGYEGNSGLIFTGIMRQKRVGRENATDTFLEILAADGSTAYTNAVIHRPLAAGTDDNDLYDLCLASLKPFGITAGYKPELSTTKYPRGRACYGMTRDFLSELAAANKATWKINDGRLDIIKIREPIPGDAVVLSAKTGLIGLPEQTVDGINARCLLNPAIKFGGVVKIDNASVQEPVQSAAWAALNWFPGKDNDGQYKVYSIINRGDTRGNTWETALITVGLDVTLTPISPTYTNQSGPSSTGY